MILDFGFDAIAMKSAGRAFKLVRTSVFTLLWVLIQITTLFFRIFQFYFHHQNISSCPLLILGISTLKYIFVIKVSTVVSHCFNSSFFDYS